MKLHIFAAIAALFLSASASAFAQSPKKATLPAEQPVVARAIVTKVQTAVTLHTADGIATPNYRVIIGNDLYWATGVGPSAGIYDVELHKNYIHVNITHLGVKPIEIYHLHIDLIQHDQAESRLAPTSPQSEVVDGRRLIVFDQNPDGHGNTRYTAVVQSTATTPETYFIFSAYGTGLSSGIYDFKLATIEKQNYLDVLTYPRGEGAHWTRYGLDAFNYVVENDAKNRVANRKAYEKQ